MVQMDDENDDLIPQKQSLFPMTADDIVDNALQNLDEQQAREVTKKAADEIVRIAVEKRKAEYRSDRAQEEMRNLINNANLLDEKVDDYKINSTFETATGTTSVEIKKSKSNTLILIAAIAIILLFVLLLVLTKF
jgi:glycosylphosphatidylinositol transamidase (GPIT) subunit GPI8